MKVRVLRDFIDLKNSKKRRKVGDVFEVDKKRFEELNSTSFGVLVEEVKEEKEVKEGAKNE